MKYKVTYVHEVEITYEAIVEASSEAEAKAKMDDFDFVSEKEMDYQGIKINIKNVEKMEK